MKTHRQVAAGEVFIHSVLESVRRRWLLLLVPTLIVGAAAAFYAFRIAPLYRSETLLRAEPMVTVRDFVEATGASLANHVLNIDEHFRSIREVILGEEVLTTVIREFRLYDLVDGRVPEAALQETRRRVVIRMDGGDEPRRNEARFVSFWVGFEANDRKVAMNVANRLADLFIRKASDARVRRVREIVGFIQGEMTPLQTKLDAQAERIKQYKQGASESLPENATGNLRFLEGLQTQYLAKNESIAKDEARRAAIVSEIKQLEEQGALEIVPAVVEKSELEKRLDELRTQYRQMQARYAPAHPELKRVEKELSEVEQLVPQERKKPRVGRSPFYLRHVELKSELEELDRRAQSYGREQQDLVKQMATYRSRVANAPVRESELAGMARDYSATQSQYQEMLERQHNARLTENFERLSREVVLRVVDPARLPLEPFRPQRRRIIFLGILGGLGLGIALAFFAEQMDSSFSSVGDFQRSCDIPLLASIPAIGRRSFSHRHSKSVTADPRIVTLRDPQSIAAEQYRILATKLRARDDGLGHTVAVTSSTGGEGKTVTAMNLAIALSGAPDRKVLLIDADLRRPRVLECLGQKTRPEKGFADLLSDPGEVEPDRYIQKAGDIYLIPGIVRCPNPFTLLGSQRILDVLQKLRMRFQFIILDTPPILPVADSIILSRCADDVLLVLRAGKTPRELFQHAVEQLDTANIRGVVLNNVDFQHSREAQAYRYYRKTYLAG